MNISTEKIVTYLNAVLLAVDVVGGHAPVCPDDNANEVQSLRQLAEEMRQALEIGSQDPNAPGYTIRE